MLEHIESVWETTTSAQDDCCGDVPAPGASLEGLVCRLGWSLVLRLRAKGVLTADDVAQQLEAVLLNVEAMGPMAQLSEIRGCLSEMLVHLQERPSPYPTM